MENVTAPEDYVEEVLKRVKPEYLLKTYNITEWTDHEDFLDQVAKRYGKLLKVCQGVVRANFVFFSKKEPKCRLMGLITEKA